MRYELGDVLDEAAQWSEETFASATIKSIATHLAREAEELKKDPTNPMEMADVLLLLNHLAYRVGVPLELAASLKLQINRRREWGSVDEEGVVEHVRIENFTEQLNAAIKRGL